MYVLYDCVSFGKRKVRKNGCLLKKGSIEDTNVNGFTGKHLNNNQYGGRQNLYKRYDQNIQRDFHLMKKNFKI